jgi:glycerol-3-phosphate dehydrogenase
MTPSSLRSPTQNLLRLVRRAPPPRTSRFRLRHVELTGGPLAYADFGGEGPAVVLVHGLGGNHLNWLPAAPMLSKHARVFALDLVGFGNTPTAGRSHGLESQREALGQFIAEVVGGPAVLVGNSMGGLIALMHAAQAPEQVARLVLVSPALPPEDLHIDAGMLGRCLRHGTPGVGEISMWLEGRQRGARGLFLDLLTLGTRDVDRVPPEVVEANISLLARRMEEHPFSHAQSYLDASRSLFWFLAQRARVDGWVRDVRADTLVLHGAHDRLVPAACSARLAQERRDWTVEILGDVGHVPQMEDAPLFVDRVVSWLNRAEEEETAPPSSRAA